MVEAHEYAPDAMNTHLATVTEAVADLIPDAVAVVQGDVRRTWSDFDDRAARLASAFQRAGLGHGSKVAEYLYNSPEYLETYLAALKIRATPVNVNYRYLDDELLYLLENSEAEVLVFHTSLGDRVARIHGKAAGVKLFIAVDDGGEVTGIGESYEDVVAANGPAARIERDPKDITMLYTGGTTGMPKGVMGRVGSSVEGWMAAVPPIVGLAPATSPDQIPGIAKQLFDEGRQFVSLPACPLMHGTGIAIGALPVTCFGGRIALLTGRGLDVTELWDLVEQEGVNGITIVGDTFGRPMLRGLEEGPTRDLSSVMLITSAGAMFSEEIRRGLLEFMPTARIVDYIAASEAGMGLALSTKDNVAPTGRFLPGPGVTVVTEDGRKVEPGSGEMGMVAVPAADPLGYYKDADKTARTFPEIDGTHYSIPGDWATIDADGLITLLGRGSQCINTGGEKVFPEEVEEVVKLHPAIDDCLVFGIPDERFGQRVVGVASVRSGTDADPEEVIAATKTRLAGYKVPRQLVLVETVPRAPNGKADYPSARELFEALVPG